MTQNQKIQIFKEMHKNEALALELQKLQGEGKGGNTFDFQCGMSVDESFAQAMAKRDATWTIIKILGFEKEYFAWDTAEEAFE